MRASLRKADDINVRLSVSLDDVYFGRVKKVQLRVLRWCPVECKLIDRSNFILVPLRGGSSTREFTYRGLGDDHRLSWVCMLTSMGDTEDEPWVAWRGDVHVTVTVDQHPMYHIDDICSDGCDLHTEVDVSLADYYYGCELSVRHFERTPMTVQYAGGKQRVHIVRGMGLLRHMQDGSTRGDVYVFFKLRLPDIPASVLRAPRTLAVFRELGFCSGALSEGAFSEGALSESDRNEAFADEEDDTHQGGL